MLVAYVFALLFSISYGMMAARGGIWERIMIPAIDIAQSVPVVGFFPAAVYFFVALAHGSRLGVEMAAVFLIFTSQAWNLALGVFESIRTIPDDSRDALSAFGASAWLRFRKLALPACVPKLVYNSILSWVAGWYFLIACEIITAGPSTYRLPGLGSYLMSAANKGRTGEMIGGLLVLLAIIVLMDAIVWQPLSNWAEKFRYEFAASGEPMRSLGMLDALGSIGPSVTRFIRQLLRRLFSIVRQALRSKAPFNPASHPAILRAANYVRITLLTGITGFLLYAVVLGMIALVRELLQPWPAIAGAIPAATACSILRLLAAYLISLAWTVPCAMAASESQAFARRLPPIAQIVGSVPATALFPLIVVFVIQVTGGMNLASILLILT